ncbi:hypothetical protein B0J12DRAFT_256004 [Macrophomina phaseolina]|uniref:Lytic polysaccharide monooxygenase n=1 Tax=Macrophomina phaseolina TaxID=35725 RepID=A0ABQ8FZC9_9PEZI|nr:hypothetical protein B0J12DRAFT_256004 [Macrophomina phaseolina]
MARRTLAYSVLALSGVCTINAHVILSQPTPYFATQLAGNKGPLPDGASYPCMWPTWSQGSGLENQPERTTIQVGAQNTVKFDGTAVHNGGGCQLSITTDTTPQRNSTFKVFLSIEGGCPGMGSTAADFPYTLPASIPSGDATFAWTWFPVSSGGKEMYMNCAPVTVTGGADDDAEFSKLPDLFVANLANDDEFTCQTQDNRVVEFPDPGELFLNKAELKSGNILGALTAPTDKNTGGTCGKAGATTLASLGQAAGAVSTAAPAPSAASTPAAGFAEVSVASSSAAAATPEAVATTLLTASSEAAAAPAATAAQPAAAAAAGSSSSGGSNGTCTSGELVCNGTSQFGICNWGKVVWQDVAAGTICENGAIKAARKARAAAEVRDRRVHLHSHGRFSGRRSFRG